MKSSFRKSFGRDLKKVKDPKVLAQLRAVIEQVEAAADLSEVSEVKKMEGAEGYYRIRVGQFRVGVVVDGENVQFVRFLHRRDMYRYFP